METTIEIYHSLKNIFSFDANPNANDKITMNSTLMLVQSNSFLILINESEYSNSKHASFTNKSNLKA